MLRRFFSLIALAFLPSSALAQLSAGGGIAGYDIVSLSSGEPLGRVLVVDLASKESLKGTVPGSEYWRWDVGLDKGEGFALVPSDEAVPSSIGILPDTIMAVSETATSGLWIESDQLSFDLDTLEPFEGAATSGRTFSVYVAGGSAGSSSSPLAWFSFSEKGQEAWASESHDAELLELAKDEVLVFVADDLPKAGSLKVFTAR